MCPSINLISVFDYRYDNRVMHYRVISVLNRSIYPIMDRSMHGKEVVLHSPTDNAMNKDCTLMCQINVLMLTKIHRFFRN